MQFLFIKKALVWAAWLLGYGIIVTFWLQGAWQQVAVADGGMLLYALARLFGLLAAYTALMQFMVMSRAGWLEPLFGIDRLAIFHRGNGIAVIMLIIGHAVLMVGSQSLLANQSLPNAIMTVLGLPGVIFAVLAAVLFGTAVGVSLYIIRKHLKFETWYAVHMVVYAGIILAALHQFMVGSDIRTNQMLWYFWIALYIFVAANIVVWRFGRPLWRSAYFSFRVEKTVLQTPTATSVYIGGRHMERFKAKGGQFVLVRFLDKKRIWQEHPFSLSWLPKDRIRLTIRQLGDFTRAIGQLQPGTPVVVSGPHGAFTHDQQVKNKVLYIAGGIGITPIRSLIEERALAGKKGDAVLLYGNRTQQDTALLDELYQLAEQIDMPLHNVLSEQPSYEGEKGFIDKEKIMRLVPDIARRDVFLCGPPPMMTSVKQALKELGVPDRQVHYERFSLHKQ